VSDRPQRGVEHAGQARGDDDALGVEDARTSAVRQAGEAASNSPG
jgi:hypothetical protein